MPNNVSARHRFMVGPPEATVLAFKSARGSRQGFKGTRFDTAATPATEIATRLSKRHQGQTGLGRRTRAATRKRGDLPRVSSSFRPGCAGSIRREDKRESSIGYDPRLEYLRFGDTVDLLRPTSVTISVISSTTIRRSLRTPRSARRKWAS